MRDNTFDFCVLGGGLAGSACALLLSRRGARVLLIERHGFDAYRAGEHLAPAALGALEALAVPVEELRQWAAASPGILSRWALDTPVYRSYQVGPGALPGLNVARAEFDRSLFLHACRSGVVGHIGPRLITADRVNGQWTLHFADPAMTCRTGFVVDATGRPAVFARRAGAIRLVFDDLVAIGAVAPGVEPPEGDGFDLVVEAVENGWWSVTTSGAGTLVATYFSRAADRRRARLSPSQWWQRGLGETQLVREFVSAADPARLTWVVAPAFPALLAPLCGEGWLAVGDAAAAYDPLCGHGVVYALESAFRAADTLIRAPGDIRGQALYGEMIRDKIATHLTRRENTYVEAATRFASSYWRFQPI